MFNEKRFQRAKEWLFRREGSKSLAKEHLETERIFESVYDEIAWMQARAEIDQRRANIKLKSILVWSCVASLWVELLFVFLHSSSVIVLPNVVLVAISALMGGSGVGLGTLLYYITKDLFRHR